MESVDKMALQGHATEGAEASLLLTQKFTGKWLSDVEDSVLDRLRFASTAEELIAIQADYRAARHFHDELLSVARKGELAAKKLRDERMTN